MTIMLEHQKRRILVIFITLSAFVNIPVSGDLEPVLQRCCLSGESWARNHTTCTGPSDMTNLQAADRLTCLTTLYICCIRTHRKTHCENGKNAAKAKRQCLVSPEEGGETYKDCCDGCTLGLQAEKMRMPCSFSRFTFGSPWDEAFRECCENPYSALGTSPQVTVNSECEVNNPCSQKCEVIANQIRCSCYPGYQLSQDLTTCNDVNECLLGTHSCNPSSETCVNAIGGFQCVANPNLPPRLGPCPPGYTYNQEKRACDDIDECLHPICPRGQRCLNSIGSYRCLTINSTATSQCPNGFTFSSDNGRCIDVDECRQGEDDCDREREICQNSYGGYQCVEKPRKNRNCPAGFKWDENKDNCEDVDECREDLHNCNQADDVCRNTMGGYECDPKCPLTMGFDPLQNKCVELDMCSSNLHNCKSDEICVPVSDSFRCVPKSVTDNCEPGFKPIVQTDGSKKCEDVNECEEFPGICEDESKVCRNDVGSYKCVVPLLLEPLVENCAPGFRFNQSRKKCVDIDECLENLDNCSRVNKNCINIDGSFECVDQPPFRICPPGYRQNPRNGSCEDINECLEGRHRCMIDKEVCQNVGGAYRCVPSSTPLRPCPTGRRYSLTTLSCEDVDECREESHDCIPTESCINSIGSYRCVPIVQCPHGYRWRPERSKCDDVDECSEGSHDCDSRSQTCVNTVGSYQCQSRPNQRVTNCGTGYTYNSISDTCEDLNECDIFQPCKSDQQCENTLGSYKCFCQQGYTLDAITKQCKDVNECQLELHSCAHSQRCDNTIGSFTCVRVTSCGTGYTLNAATNHCEDDDECTLGNHNCGNGFVCRNTAGSFRCDRSKCPAGQKLLSDGTCKVVICGTGMEHDDDGNCIDVNECIRGHACRTYQRCVNTVGSYRCQNLINCEAGYELNEQGDQCVDIDECVRGLAECDQQQTCRNRPGGYICECPRGYSLNTQRVCEDIDECTRFRGQICASHSECINTQGSYKCNCNEGFRAGNDDKTCADVDECSESPNICQQTCNNVWGSYQCSCKLGYTLGPDERSCIDINECEVYGGLGNLCIGFCINEPGSFKCSCPSGYRLASDGRTCQDIDECREQNVCNDDKAVCLNTRGGYKCNRIDCPPNYYKDNSHKNRCKRVTRDCQTGDCLKEPLSYSYNYITFVSNMRLPLSGQVDLFTMRGPSFQSTTVQFELQLTSARAPPGTTPATKDYFHLRRTAYNEAMIALTKSITGPQEIELDLVMKIYHNGLYGGTAVAKIFLFVTEYNF
ncbi:fibrillin-1 isoform X2 [Parasteatoda tepidariorum]|uniref:fibrillin-1 isoform X2 n=1 Tax=Parasteatoda tepidariorum TaxID=114398 RepID=UPI00077FCAD2|nr:fibulin-1 isoform X2 [Parasteatoda tepidariorum]